MLQPITSAVRGTVVSPYQRAVAAGDVETAVIFAGEAVDLIDRVVPAAALVRRIGVEVEAQLRVGGAMLAERQITPPQD